MTRGRSLSSVAFCAFLSISSPSLLHYHRIIGIILFTKLHPLKRFKLFSALFGLARSSSSRRKPPSPRSSRSHCPIMSSSMHAARGGAGLVLLGSMRYRAHLRLGSRGFLPQRLCCPPLAWMLYDSMTLVRGRRCTSRHYSSRDWIP
jgi:hypothetical protein